LRGIRVPEYVMVPLSGGGEEKRGGNKFRGRVTKEREKGEVGEGGLGFQGGDMVEPWGVGNYFGGPTFKNRERNIYFEEREEKWLGVARGRV